MFTTDSEGQTTLDPANVRKLWVDALRSGDYEQTTGWLRAVDVNDHKPGYCCLGVLCDLAVKHGVIDPPVSEFEFTTGEVLSYGTETQQLPRAVVDWAGLPSSDPDVDVPWARIHDDEDWDELYEGAPHPDTDEMNIAELNDSFKFNFDDLADVIVENFGVAK